MNRNEIWDEIKNDKTTVYGKPMLDMFLMATDTLDSAHYEELPPGKREAVRPGVRLSSTRDPEEAIRAIKDGAKNLNETIDHILHEGEVAEKWRVLAVISEQLGEKLRPHQFGNLLDMAAHLGLKEFAEFLVELPRFGGLIRGGDENLLWASVPLAIWEKHNEIARTIATKIAESMEKEAEDETWMPHDDQRLSRARIARHAADKGMWKALDFVSSIHGRGSLDGESVLIAAVEDINPEAASIAILHGEDGGELLRALQRTATIRHHQVSTLAKTARDRNRQIAKMIIDALPADAKIDPSIAKTAESNKNYEVADLVRTAIAVRIHQG